MTRMSSTNHRVFKTHLCVNVGISVIWQRSLIACYSLAGLFCLTLSLDMVVRLGLCLTALAYGLYLALFKHGLRNRSRVVRITYSQQQGWRLLLACGREVKTSLRLPVYVTRFLVIARFGCGKFSGCPVVIPADAVDNDEFRHLRVRLLQSAHGDRN